MKRFIIIIGICLICSGFGEESSNDNATKKITEPDGVCGVKFGDDLETAKKTLIDNGWRYEKSEKNIIAFVGEFAGIANATILCVFYENKASQLILCLPKASGDFTQYNKFKELLTDKYGTPQEDNRVFIHGYKMGDGYELQAIKFGKGFVLATWRFDTSEICIMLNCDGDVNIYYKHIKLDNLREKAEKEKAKNAL